MAQVFLGLGSNLGDRAANLGLAVAAVCSLGPVRRSRWYETEPVGLPGAPRFLNGVIGLNTNRSPLQLMGYVLEVERQFGRNQTDRSSSRTIDIDLLLYGSRVVNEPGLEIPHPRMHERAFVLVPLCELAREFVHPVLGRTMSGLLSGIDTTGVRTFPS